MAVGLSTVLYRGIIRKKFSQNAANELPPAILFSRYCRTFNCHLEVEIEGREKRNKQIKKVRSDVVDRKLPNEDWSQHLPLAQAS